MWCEQRDSEQIEGEKEEGGGGEEGETYAYECVCVCVCRVCDPCMFVCLRVRVLD